jgi:glyoxylase-like metal-dependent hydrolase (beta-lactamase superfamily II)
VHLVILAITHESTIQQVEGEQMLVNSYVVHGPEGLVVVDGQLTISDARRVRALIDAIGRPLAGVLITHPHPDHYAGAGLIADDDVPIVATAAVDTVIRRDDAEKNTVVGPMMGAEWPSRRRFPDVLVDSGATLELAGLSFTVRDLGPGESHRDTLWTLDDHTIFVGDVAYNDMHAYLFDGEHQAWLTSLDQLHRDLPDNVVLYPGHGAPTGKDILEAQSAYVPTFVEVVAAHASMSEDDRRTAVLARVHDLMPNDRLLSSWN